MDQLAFPLEPEEPVLTLEPVVGWRMWRVELDGAGPVLGSPLRGDRWPAMEPVRARCVPALHRHRSPDPSCTCGLYATLRLGPLRALAMSPHVGPASLVVGRVAMWGRVVEHEAGYRGELAYPDRIRVVCALCFGAGRRPVPTRVFRSSSRLIAACARHRPVAEPLDMSPSDLQAELLSRYAVDLLPIEALGRVRVRASLPGPALVLVKQARREALALSRSWLGWLAAMALIALFSAWRATQPLDTEPAPLPSPAREVVPLAGTGDPIRWPLRERTPVERFRFTFLCGRLRGDAVTLVGCGSSSADVAGFADLPPEPRGDCRDSSGYTRKLRFSACWIDFESVLDVPPSGGSLACTPPACLGEPPS